MIGAGSEGKTVQARPDLAESMGVPSDAVIAISYSGLSILIFFCVGLVVALSPLFFKYRKLQNDMVVGGTNSLVLSAACHVPRVPRVSGEPITTYCIEYDVSTNAKSNTK